MSRFDLFYVENRESVSSSYTTATTSGATTLQGYGSTFTMASAPTPNFSQGQVVALTSGGTTAYCTVVYVSGTSIRLLPIRSVADSAGVVGSSFPNGSTITAGGLVPQQAATLVIDLTDAPFTSATYVIMATGRMSSDTTGSVGVAALRRMDTFGDPISGTGGYGSATTTYSAGSANELATFQAAIPETLYGGVRYEFAIDFSTTTANATVTFDEARLVAVRYDTITSSGTGKTAETTTTSTSLQTHLSLTSNLTAGDYLVVATWVAGISNLTYSAVVQVENSGTALSTSQFTPNATGDYLSGGFCGIVTLGGTNALALKYRTTNASGTAKIKNSFLAAIPLPPAFTAGYATTAGDASASPTDNSWQTLVTATPGSALSAGRHLQILSAATGGDATYRYRIRMTTAGDVVTDELAGFRVGLNNALAMFSFARETLGSGTTANNVLIEGKSMNAGGSTFRANTPRVSWIAERADIEPKHDTPVTVTADVELGGQILRSWGSTTTTDRYVRKMADVTLMSRVIVSADNGGTVQTELYTEVASLGSLAAKTWYWDSANLDLYVQMQASVSPSDASTSVVVVPMALVSRSAVDLEVSPGVYHPYEARISKTPGVSEELSSSGGRFEVSRSIGSIDLAASDGAYDDRIVRHSMDSYRVRLRRGWASLSDRLADLDVYATAVTGMPSSDFETLRLRLFDRHVLMSEPVATTLVPVREGAEERAGQLIPVVYGSVRRLVAYRTTNEVAYSTDWNTFKFASHAVYSVSAVYLDATNAIPVDNLEVQKGAEYLDVGTIRVKNSAFADSTKPQDTVFVDCVGRTTDPTDSTTPGIVTPGAIIQDILIDFGGFEGTELDTASFRLLDYRWRSQLVGTDGFSRQAPLLGVVIGEEPLSEVIARVAGDAFAYVCTTTYGRIAVRVPDLDGGNLTENPGMEMFASGVWPWVAASSATLTLATSRKMDGQRALEVGNGSNASANAVQAVILPRPGNYVFTCMASLNSGVSDAFTLGMTRPNGTTVVSDPVIISTDRWTRATLVATLDPGEVGTAYIRIYPASGSATATTVTVDNVELYEVAAVVTQQNSMPVGVQFSDEHYYEAAVTYGVNLEQNQYASRAVVTDTEARLFSTTASEGQFAIASSKRADIGMTLYKDSASAAGVAAALVNYYSRMRHVLSIDVMGLSVLPTVGQYVYITDHPRIPEVVDGNPIWRITRVGFEPDTAQTISLDVERQSDPVGDRVAISAESIPLGAIMLTTSSGAITDYTEVANLQGKFVRGATKANITASLGSHTHTHTLDHTHAIASHTHTWTASASATLVAVPGTLKFSGVSYDAPGPSANVGPASTFVAARGNASGHSHTVSGSGASASATGTSSSPTATLTTVPGSNIPAYIRVRFMQRTAASVGTISQSLIIGWGSSTMPTGWERCDGTGGRPNLDGYYVRGATSNAAVNTAVATSSYVPSSTGSTMKVASASNISVGKRLSVASGGNSMAVVVTAISGTDLTVTPIYEVGDDIVTYSVGSTVTGIAEVVNTTMTPTAHDHSAVAPSHTHTGGGHTHSTTTRQLIAASPVSSTVVVYAPGYGSGMGSRVVADHGHDVTPTLTASDEASSGATGTISSAAAQVPDTYEVVWIRPSSADETRLPTGAMALWTQSSVPPSGWEVVGEAVGKLLKGAAASAGPVSRTGGHSHSFTGSQHTFAHSHGGTQVERSSDADSIQTDFPMWGNSGTTVSAAAYADGNNYRLGHAHDVTVTTASTSGTMSATGTLTSSSDSTLPPHAKVLVIRKL